MNTDVKKSKYWILACNENNGDSLNIPPGKLEQIKNFFPLSERNLGFIFSNEKDLQGVFTIQKIEEDFFIKPIRFYKNPVSQKHLTRHGMAKIGSRAHGLNGNGIMDLGPLDFRKLLDIAKQINKPKSPPLMIFTQFQDEKIKFIVRTNDSSPDIKLDLIRDIHSLRRAGLLLLDYKQQLHNASGDQKRFLKIYKELQINARTITSTLFDSRYDWIAFLNRNIFMSGTSHGLFPWELLTSAEKIISMERNFSRSQNWSGNTYQADRAARKKVLPSLVFLDAIQNAASENEWKQIHQALRLFGNVKAEYIRVTAVKDVLRKAKEYSMVHLVAHGEILDNCLTVDINGKPLPLVPDEFYLPLPVFLVAHICSSVEEREIQSPAFPAHHVLLPDIYVKEGSQDAFLRTLYLKILGGNSFAVAVRLARYAALLEHEDPFAFVYYGNGDLSWDNYRFFNQKIINS